MRRNDQPWTWSEHYYGLIEEGMRQGDRLAVCVAHQGRHPFLFELDACHEIPAPQTKLERVRIATQDITGPSWTNPDEGQFNPADLAAVIVLAARELRGERTYLPEPKVAPKPTGAHSEPVVRRRLVDDAR